MSTMRSVPPSEARLFGWHAAGGAPAPHGLSHGEPAQSDVVEHGNPLLGPPVHVPVSIPLDDR
jgi:hypothetical protein